MVTAKRFCKSLWSQINLSKYKGKNNVCYLERRMLPISLLNISCGVLGSRTIYNATGRNLTCNPTLGRLKTYYLIPLIAQNLKYILPDFTHVTVDSTLNRGSMRGNMKLYPHVTTFITNSKKH